MNLILILRRIFQLELTMNRLYRDVQAIWETGCFRLIICNAVCLHT